MLTLTHPSFFVRLNDDVFSALKAAAEGEAKTVSADDIRRIGFDPADDAFFLDQLAHLYFPGVSISVSGCGCG